MTVAGNLNDGWIDVLARRASSGSCVCVTVIEVRGSAPRAPGSRMIITHNDQWGSIGGGNLEYTACAHARTLLADPHKAAQHTHLYGLGPALNQCCGGAVTLLFQRFLSVPDCMIDHRGQTGWMLGRIDGSEPELRWSESLPGWVHADVGDFAVLEHGNERWMVERLQARSLPLVIFGAGHVAQALVPLLAGLPFSLRWLDNRESFASSPAVEFQPDPVAAVAGCAARSAYLVMTHSHELDEALVSAVLSRRDAAWLGLIGSVAKRRRFEHRLSAAGHGAEELQFLVCPIGLAGISGKRPATIALSVAAQLLQDCVPESWR